MLRTVNFNYHPTDRINDPLHYVMDNKTFDSQLKSALENLEVPLEPTAWEAFEQRFPAPVPQPADAVDQAVRRSMQQLDTPYQPAHWEILASRLTRIEQLRRRIWVSKSAEAAILLLLLLLGNAYGFFGFQPRHSTPAAPARQEPMADAGKTRTGRTHALPNNSGPQENNGGFFVPLDASQRVGNESFVNNGLVSESALSLQATAPDVAIVTLQNEPGQRSVMLPFSPLSTLDFMTLSLQELLNPLKEVTPKAPLASRFYMATYASLDQNKVRMGTESRQSPGYGGGLLIGFRPGKWGVEAGVAFSQKNYTPQKQVEIYAGSLNQGYYGSFADQVNADLVSVPVKVTRRVARFGKTSVHATAGMTANVAIEKNYHYQKIYYPGSQPPPIGQATGQPSLRQDGQGVFEGGQLGDNAYVTADLGLRVEHSVGKRLVAFVEPAYQFNVSGQSIGPKPARINTVGIHAGVMASL